MMYHPNEVARRARVASFVLMGIFLILCASFFRTQVINYGKYALESDKNRLRAIPIPAQRGTIYDRNGLVIAEDVPGYTVSLLAKNVDSLRAQLVRLAQFVPLAPREIDRLANPRIFSATTRTIVLSNADFEQVAVLKERQFIDFPGLVIEAAPKRNYPHGKGVVAFTGYMGEITDSQLNLPKYETYGRGAQVGILGLEEQYEDRLAGVDGKRWLEVNASNQIVNEQSVSPALQPHPGEDLHTNIDLDLQRFIADSIFGDKLQGGVIVMNPATGEVLALHSGPSFDPNDFIGGISSAKFDSLLKDKRNPLYNKVIKGAYPPASTFKLATAVMALQAGLVTLDEHMASPCTASGYKVGNRYFHCWKSKTGGHGSLSLAGAIQGSCNVYFFQLGQRLTLTKLLAGGVDLGFAARSGIDLPGEKQPIYYSNFESYDKRYGANLWSREGETVMLSIGQGAATQTVANMAKFYSALAMDGYAATPQIISGTPPERKQVFKLTPEQNVGVREALAAVVSGGTAAASRIEGLRLAGKTGTAENSSKLGDHGWFVGFAPVDKPKLLVAMIIEHGEHGSVVALQASRIFARYFKESKVLIMETGG